MIFLAIRARRSRIICHLNEGTYPSLAALIRDIAKQVQVAGGLNKISAAQVGNLRNDMYLASEAIRFLQKDKENDLSKQDIATLGAYKKSLDNATKFIPDWVKASVAIALGLGTMIGWKRIVVTVGEKIGKEHLTYGQGAAAEITAMGTIGLADSFGLPVSTTHVLSSGVAGTMAANGSGIQMSTVRSILLAWVFTLPSAIALSAFLFVVFRRIYCKRKICWLLGALKRLCDGGCAEFPSCVEIFSAHPRDNL
jgi:PiT family inorganic phosphate transporter